MVKRGCFTSDGTNILFHTVEIDWNLGFDKRAKHGYISRIQEQLPLDCKPVIDVTSASNDKIGRSMSPIFLHTKDGECVEDLYPKYGIPGVIDWIYITSLSTIQRGVIAHHNGFMDVFYSPDKGRNTQAISCACFKLLLLTNKLSILDDVQTFVDWYNEVPLFNI